MNSGLRPVHRVSCDERAGLALAWADAGRHHMKLLPPSPLLEAPDACETAEVSPTVLGLWRRVRKRQNHVFS